MLRRRRQDPSVKKKGIVWDNAGKEYGKTKEVEKLSRKEIGSF